MYILEVSYGCPSEKYPLNGIFQMDQAKGLDSIGNKVIFAAIDTRSIRQWRRWGITEHKAENIPVIEFNFPIGPIAPGISDEICKCGFSLVLRRTIRKYGKPDVVHVHFGETARCVVDACKEKKIPFVLTEHSSAINKDNLSEAEINSRRKVYKNAEAVIAVSSALAKRIKQYFDVNAVVIPNIIDLSSFRVKRVEHTGFKIISAGSLKSGKGFDIVVKAFHRCLNQGMKAQLVIMGDGPERKSLEKMVKERNMNEYVSFFGRYTREEFADELSKADVFALASRGETFGVVYAEALTCGVPVIATKCGGPEDFVNDKCGILVDVDSVEGLTDAMHIMYKNSSDYNYKKISGDIKNNFSQAEISRRIMEIFMKH